MKTTHRKWLMATSAAVGACALALGGAALPAAAEDAPDGTALSTQDGTDKYELAAARAETSVKEIKSAEAAGEIKVADNGYVLHIDDARSEAKASTFALPVAPLGAPVPGDPGAGSRPGAPVTIYLDFDGETLQGTQWNDDSGRPTLDFAPAGVANTAFRADVWAGVAEDYAPFNVNVTTTRPSDDKLYKTSADDAEYGVHVIVTDSFTDVLPSAEDSSGQAWFSGAGSKYLTGALVFTYGATGGNPAAATAKDIADISSHEAGHNFGLEHDGIAGEPSEYYSPTAGVWGPIMGSTYDVPLTQWSNGDYASSTNQQDDLSTITDRSKVFYDILSVTVDGQPYNGGVCPVGDADPANPEPGDQFYVPNAENLCDGTGAAVVVTWWFTDRADFAADQVGDDAAHATNLDNDGTFEGAGVIERTADVDVFSVITAGGSFTATVEVADFSPNLDAKLTLTDASGAVVAENDAPTTRASIEVANGLGATVTAADLDPGIYYLAIDGVGSGSGAGATPTDAGGYSDYASLGNYTLSGAAAELITEDIAIDTPADGTVVTGGADVEVAGTATPNATVTLTVGGVVVATTQADDEGAWTANVTANEFGNTAIVASQKVSGIDIPGTATVTVTAPVDAPVIKAPADGSSTADTTPDVSGTGIPGATVTITVSNGSGVSVTASAVVDGSGNWSLTLGQLPAGAYTVNATQAINGVTSDAAEAVAFTVTQAPTTGGNTTPGGNLATTGGDLDGVTMSLLVAGVLLAAGASVAFGVRARRKVSVES